MTSTLGAAAVVVVQHARIDFDDLAIKALEHTATWRRRVADDNAIGADGLKCARQLVDLDQFTADDIAAIPERAIKRV